jgi:hypothetical protein
MRCSRLARSESAMRGARTRPYLLRVCSVEMFTPNALLKTRLEQAVFFSDPQASVRYQGTWTDGSLLCD